MEIAVTLVLDSGVQMCTHRKPQDQVFKMHTSTVCKSYLDIYYKLKQKKGPYFPGLYLPSHVMVGLQPLGNHLVLWPQLAPGKTPTLRDPQ